MRDGWSAGFSLQMVWFITDGRHLVLIVKDVTSWALGVLRDVLISSITDGRHLVLIVKDIT